MDFILKILHDAILFTGPILLCTLGGLFAYKANVINIGLEGMMLFGGFISTLVIFFTESWVLGIIAAIFLSVLLGLLFSYFGVTKNANFIITGFAINLLAIAVGKYTLALLGRTDINVISVTSAVNSDINLWLIRDIPILNTIFNNLPFLTYFSFILIIIANILLYKTKFGTYVRVVGENEEASKSVGINGNKIKYVAIIIGAILCAFAGYNVAVDQLASYTPAITAGTGFIAIAAIYCGNGNPKKVSIYAILFGISKSLAVNLALIIGSIAGLLQIIPYVMIVIVLSVVAILKKKKSLIRGLYDE